MNFLEICQKVREKVGVPGTGPSAVTSQTGAHLRIVNCVIEAWREIQSQHTTWKFMQKNGTLSLSNATQSYSRATIVAANSTYGRLLKDTMKFSDGGRLTFRTFQRWEETNTDIGTQTGQPSLFTEDSDRALLFYPIPNGSYTVRFRFMRTPQVLAANSDEPICPDEFHLAIVYRAVLLYANLDEADPLYKTNEPEWLNWMAKLESDQLPDLTIADGGYGSPR